MTSSDSGAVLLQRRERVLATTFTGLAGAMGLGRFAYTPMLPIITGAGLLSAGGGALIAAANYAGYLLGAVCLSARPAWNTRGTVRAVALFLVITQAGMCLPLGLLGWGILRFLAGAASAWLFIACVHAVSHRVALGRLRPDASGMMFAGVGTGIALTGVLVTTAAGVMDWSRLWLLVSLLTAALLLPIGQDPPRAIPQQPRSAPLAGSRSHTGHRSAWRILCLVYLLEGLGYIIVGTFLVAAITSPSGVSLGPVVWVVAGIAAVPSTLMWTRLARKCGSLRCLLFALALQAFGALLPAITHEPAWGFLAAALFGATFMGITALAIDAGVALRGATAGGPLTVAYGLGQILGPLLVAPIIRTSYGTAFGTAATVLISAAALTILIPRDGVHHVRHP